MLAVLAIASQLLLPPLAEWRLRSNLERDADGIEVQVHAFPALKVLFGRADRVEVTADAGRSSGSGKLGDTLGETRRTDRLDARVARLRTRGLLMRDVTLRKRGDTLEGRATILPADVARALPPGIKLRPAGAGDDGIVLRGSVDTLGVKASARFRVVVRDGAIVIDPISRGLARLLVITVFRDDDVRVESLRQVSRSGRYEFTVRGRVTG